ncbi:MAG: hypothetical protein NWE93_14900 [Candidatus Bathyarchaeota archaeon]|nr:hypothetical protein [Candidatus Bathyarchaeota archaeon]
MKTQKQSSAKRASIIAITAALYTVFFFLSYTITLPNFTLLYLPIILLGVFPFWFGWSGLVGSMIGGFVGGAFVEGLGLLGIFEAVVALVIYLINWVLIPKMAAENNSKRSLAIMMSVLAVSLLAGTSYILLQYTVLPQLFTTTQAFAVLIPTYFINLPIVLIACPALIRAISPKLRTWGMYVGNFAEWRKKNSA